MAHRFGPTRGEADNSAGPERSLKRDWLPARGFHHGPEREELHDEAGDTTAVELDRQNARSETDDEG